MGKAAMADFVHVLSLRQCFTQDLLQREFVGVELVNTFKHVQRRDVLHQHLFKPGEEASPGEIGRSNGAGCGEEQGICAERALQSRCL